MRLSWRCQEDWSQHRRVLTLVLLRLLSLRRLDAYGGVEVGDIVEESHLVG